MIVFLGLATVTCARGLSLYRLSFLILIFAVVAGALLSPVAQARAVPVVRFEAESRGGWTVAEECRAIWRAEGPALAAVLVPATASADSVVCLVMNTSSFQQHFGSRLPDWGVGVAVGHGHLIALDYSRLPAVGRGVREVFMHEMVHALLFQGAEGRWLPTWLHEGAAMRYSGEWRFADTVSLILDGQVPNLASLQGAFPGSAHRADRAYRTSLLAVDRLMNEYGPDVIADLVAATVREGDFSTAFAAVTGTTDTEFYADFARSMRLRYGWLVFWTRWPSLFVLLAVLLLVGGTRKIIISRRRLAEMEDEETVYGPNDYN